MSLLAGFLSGCTRAPAGSAPTAVGLNDELAYVHIDDSHAPFKRSEVRPGGPKQVFSQEQRQWECAKAPTKDQKPGYSTQACRYVGEPGNGYKVGKVKLIRTEKKAKKAYNKEYRKFIKADTKAHGGKERFEDEPLSDYACRKSNSVKCVAYRGGKRLTSTQVATAKTVKAPSVPRAPRAPKAKKATKPAPAKKPAKARSPEDIDERPLSPEEEANVTDMDVNFNTVPASAVVTANVKYATDKESFDNADKNIFSKSKSGTLTGKVAAAWREYVLNPDAPAAAGSDDPKWADAWNKMENRLLYYGVVDPKSGPPIDMTGRARKLTDAQRAVKSTQAKKRRAKQVNYKGSKEDRRAASKNFGHRYDPDANYER